MEYLPVLILMAAGALVAGAASVLSSLLGPKLANRMKDSPFECGVPPIGDAQHRISVRFYLVAILFLLFDIEVIFFFPFGVVFREFLAINHFLIWEMGVFVTLLLVGYVYVVRKGALNWD